MNIYDVGPLEANLMIYGEPHQGTLGYMRESAERFTNALSDFGRGVMETMAERYHAVYDASTLWLARQALTKYDTGFKADIVYSFTELEQIQSAQLQMQRWVMANTALRELYHKQRCDGYSDTYVDFHPGMIGEDHYDYRRVIEGVVRDAPNDEFMWTTYLDDLHPDDRRLRLDEQADIMSTWAFVEHYIKLGEDPSNRFGGPL